jgi:hypothetical protein
MTKLWKRISVFFTLLLATVASVVLNFYNSEIRVTNLQLNVTGSTCDILIDRRMDVAVAKSNVKNTEIRFHNFVICFPNGRHTLRYL